MKAPTALLMPQLFAKHFCMLCRFSLQHKQQLLGLPAGMCIKVKVGQQEQAYNPISTDETPGEVVLLVKVRACSTVRIVAYCNMPQQHSGIKQLLVR